MTGKAIKYGDNISTDAIIAGKYTKTLNFQDLADHAMEDLDPDFQEKVKNRSFLVAGTYFGCGSSREQAPTALQVSGIQCILAKEFSRIFFRNAINVGMCVAECDTDLIDDGDSLSFSPGDRFVINHTKDLRIPVAGMPQIMVDILAAGGVTEYLLKNNGSIGD